MPVLGSGIHDLRLAKQDVDGRPSPAMTLIENTTEASNLNRTPVLLYMTWRLVAARHRVGIRIMALI
jgi:hypothetical protein